MEDLKHKIEAVLFTIGRPTTIAQIMDLIHYNNPQDIHSCLNSLIEEYSKKDSSLEILQDNNRYRMNIKSNFMPLVKNLMPNTELDKPTIASLAVIAWKQPILQSKIVKIRGNTAYEHVKLLEELSFVTTEKHKLSKLVKLSPKFYEYFDTNHSSLQQSLTKTKEPTPIRKDVPDLLANLEKPKEIVSDKEIPKKIEQQEPIEEKEPLKKQETIEEQETIEKQEPVEEKEPLKKQESVEKQETIEEKEPVEKQDPIKKLKKDNPELFEDLEEGTEVIINSKDNV